ncbi:histidine phosphatase superfamily [Bipolaris maydis]|nr:histidine phosphatase superfamily [Bipolaris maydis]
MASRNYITLILASIATSVSATEVDLGWYPPKKSWINNLDQILNGTGTNGFIFNSSQLPAGVGYGTYNWCNMPHVRKEEYVKADDKFELAYVETSASTYWSVYTDPVNPFAQAGFNGSCQFPQITLEGLEDSWQHGKDLYGVYHDLLGFLPSQIDNKVTYRVSNNVITSQVAGMLIQGMYNPKGNVPLHIQPSDIDSLAPSYSCPAASKLYSTYGVGSFAANWTAHLSATAPLFKALDTVSGVAPTSAEWHNWFDHYYDNLSARQCHAKPLPCNISDPGLCIDQSQADSVYRLGQYEYSFIYRDAPQSLQAAAGSYGVFLAELASRVRAAMAGQSDIIYRHNVAHDGSLARLLSFLQVEQMVWVGMGSEVVFEVYKRAGGETKWFIRILWGGQVLRSSNPSLGRKEGSVDMLEVKVFLAYVDGLVGRGAEKVVAFCKG